MSKIAFFCIPAHGHTNPTLEVVRELTRRGHDVLYFSYQAFRKKIEAAGATFIACDPYDVEMNLRPEDAARVGKDMGFSIKLLVQTTLALDGMVCETLKKWHPDCVIADSMAAWGKFAALKLGIPFISSTTTFAFNRYSARIMKPSLSQVFSMIAAMPSVRRDLKLLQSHGYPVKNLLSLIQNDDETDTLVYTSKAFQPRSDTFSEHYAFVGPSLHVPQPFKRDSRKTIYISMGTVNNRMPDFYQNCVEAFSDGMYRALLSVGDGTDIAALGPLPESVSVYGHVEQTAVLQSADAFLSHCGMNSVSESLYFGVPLVLFPQTAEQSGVANRTAELGAGLFLKENRPEAIRRAVDTLLGDAAYTQSARRIADSFKRAGGANAAADFVESRLRKRA